MRTRLSAILLLLSLTLMAQTLDPPVVKTQVEPSYPDALKFYITDYPIVKLTIDEKGEPYAIESPMKIPDNVVQALRKARFEPAHQRKTPVAVAISMMLPIRRSLSEAQGLGRTFVTTNEITDADRIAKGLDDAGEAAIEQQIAQSPADVQQHLVAVRYRNLHDSPANESGRLKELRWFAENSPRYEFLGMPGASPRWEETGSEDYEALRKLWIGKLTADQAILDNATNFLRITDPVEAETRAPESREDHRPRDESSGRPLRLRRNGNNRRRSLPEHVSGTVRATGIGPLRGAGAREIAQNGGYAFAFLRPPYRGRVRVTLAFCTALLERAKQFYPDATANCDPVVRKPSSGSARMGGTVIAASLIKRVTPVFPPEAHNRGVYGTVKFQALIGKDGKIKDLELLSAPFLLYDSSRKAVEQWEYRPTTLNGEPVDVLTTIDVNFTRQ